MHNESFCPNYGIREKLYILMIFGISGVSLLFPKYNEKSRRSTGTAFCLFLGLIVISLGIVSQDYNNHIARCLFVISFVLTLIFYDCYYGKVHKNALIHIVNGGYITVSIYFVVIKNFSENFSDIWLSILPSTSLAFDMLVLCLLFLNIGYYVVPELFYPFKKLILRWSLSKKNLFNLYFINNISSKNKLIIVFLCLGLITRIYNLLLGNIYYTDGSGIPFIISSFLSQFERLYFVALYYCYADCLKSKFQDRYFKNLSLFLLSFEFLYQLFSGSKGRFFYFVFLPVAMVYILVQRKVSWKTILIIVFLGCFSWLLIYPTLVIYRGAVVSSGLSGSSLNPISIFTESISILNRLTPKSYIDIIFTPFTRSGVAEQVAAMTSIVHYQVSEDGSLLWQRLFLFWIPRFLWADKPTSLSGNVIGRMSNRIGDEDFTTSVLTTAPGELFLYHGMLGSILMLIPGVLFWIVNTIISPFKLYSTFKVSLLITFLPLFKGLLSGNFEAGLTGIVIQLSLVYFALFIIKGFFVSSRT